MDIGGQDLCEDVIQVVPRRHKDKAHHFPSNLLAKPDHLDAEIPVAASYDVVVHHRDTGLVVFKELGGADHLETQLDEEVV